jgi:hypothetical protein
VFYTAFERKMLTLMEELRLNCRTSISLLQQMITNRTNEEICESIFRDRLPVCTMEELILLNDDVRSIDIRGQMVRLMLNIFRMSDILVFVSLKLFGRDILP